MRFMRVWLTAACLACTFALGAADVSTAAQKQRKPKDATALCVDGTYSKAQSQQGACSSHGGIKTWYGAEAKTEARADRAERKVARTEEKAERKVQRTEEKAAVARPANAPATATAKCNDGTYSSAAQRRGACSNHGGVAEFYIGRAQ